MEQFDLFDTIPKKSPLADKMRPDNLDGFIGQEHIVNSNSLLYRAVKADKIPSCIFWGPPGTGKTTLAHIIANQTKGNFVKLNAVSSGVSDAKKVIEEARNNLKLYQRKTYLLLDECHRWSKSQSDCVLSAMEDGSIILIGSTTENPFASMTPAIVSRCRVFEFKKLSEENIINALKKALADNKNGLGNFNAKADDKALRYIASFSGGDLRAAYNAIELAVLSTPANEKGEIIIDEKIASESMQRPYLSIDESLYYDLISAFIKSMRGSDANAALYYFNRLLLAGCDPMLLARRIVIHSSEDVGLADPQALVIAVAAMQAFEKIGLPEGRIPLANAIIYICNAKKSNSVVNALYSSEEAAKNGAMDTVPPYLKDQNFRSSTEFENDKSYKYPHDYGGYVEQQYLPDRVKNDIYYVPSNIGEDKGRKK